MNPKILLLDTETAPAIAYIWKLWEKTYSMNMVAADWYFLCWCAKWLGEDTIYSAALPDYSLYQKQSDNDIELLKAIYPLLDEADIVIAHNAPFDIKKINTRFVIHGINPPSPYKVIDTLKVARQNFSFMSNRLDDLGKTLGVGEKAKTGGFQLWADCLAGKKSAWVKMVSYCAQDVRLLEEVYFALMPFMKGTPNLSIYNETDELVCPKCGSNKINKKGFAYTVLFKYQRWVCKSCGSWSRSRDSIKGSTKALSNL